MILDRHISQSLADISQALMNVPESITGTFQEFDKDDLIEFSKEFEGMMQTYRGALYEISTKLEILDDEYSTLYSHNPIHHMERRLKSVPSIIGKLALYHNPFTLESIQKNVLDIAGIRVVCDYLDDVYTVANMLSDQTDISIIDIKDYIDSPKESGYRSLHVIYTVPVFLTTGPQETPVEVQFRTNSMDNWASLEHRLRYKSDIDPAHVARHADTLRRCADQLYEIDVTMQSINRDLISAPRENSISVDA